MRELFIGQSPIVSGELEKTLRIILQFRTNAFFCRCCVLVNGDDSILAAGGFILQIMPAQDETISFIEDRLQKIPPVSTLIECLSPEELLYAVLEKIK